MKFKVPQNVEIEDKIIAFVSLRQLFILMGGGGVAYIIYIVSVDRFPLTAYIVPVSVVIILTVLIAFFKIDNITFLKAITLFLEGIINPNKRIWQHYTSLPDHLDLLGAEEHRTQKPVSKKETSILDLDVIAENLDENG